MSKRCKGRKSADVIAGIGTMVRSAFEGLVAGMDISRHQLIVLVVILLGGITASTVAYVAVKDWEMGKIDSDFARRFDQVVASLERKLDMDSAVLHTVAGLERVRGDLRREDLSAAVDPSWAGAEGIRAFGWAPRLPPSQGNSEGRGSGTGTPADETGGGSEPFERDVRSGRRVPLAPRSQYFPVAFVSPAAANASLAGFDLGSDPIYRAAMRRARDTGKAAATSPFVYQSGDDAERAIAVVMPVFRGGSTGETPEQADRPIAGYAFGVFRVDAFLGAVTFGMSDVMSIDVADTGDGERDTNAIWLFGNGFAHPTAQAPTGYSQDATVDVFGRTWHLYAKPQPGYVFAHRTWQAEGLLVAGLQFAALLDAYLLLVFGRTARVEGLVILRTAALQRSNHQLKREMINRLAAERALRLGEERIKSLFDVDDAGLGLTGLAIPSASGEGDDAKSQWAVYGETPGVGQADPAVVRSPDDFRSPVAAMRVAAKILARHDTLSADEISKFVDIIVDGGEQLSHLINETLDLSVLEAARARRLTFGSVDPDRLLSRAACIANTYAARKAIDVRADSDAELPAAMADEDRVVQVLTNLAENAVRFTQPGGHVRLAAERHNGNYLRFSITDSGLGMTALEQATAFDAFAVEGDVVDGHSQSGSVGLAVCKEVVERHGGTIWVDSRRGVGTTFSFTLPVVSKRQASVPAQA